MAFYVYILASRRNGTLYIGMTDNLIQASGCIVTGRSQALRNSNGVKMLVWHEQHETRASALMRERQMKKWNRSWKIRMIEQSNPQWSDLYGNFTL